MITTDRLKAHEDTASAMEVRYFLREAIQIIKLGAVGHLEAQLSAGPDPGAVGRLNWALGYVDSWWHGADDVVVGTRDVGRCEQLEAENARLRAQIEGR